MNAPSLLELIADRHCKRAFLDLPVERGLIEAALRVAANAPSSKNTQSWQVEVLTGRTRDELSRRLCEAFDRQVAPVPDYANRPARPDAVLQRREADYGAALLAHAQVDRHDEPARTRHRRRNFVFFDAPVELIFHLPGNAAPGNFLDFGCFMQNVALGLHAQGLGCCPQFSVASYSPIIHALFGWEEKRCVVAGMAVGHFDPDHPENRFVPTRAPLAEFCQWHD